MVTKVHLNPASGEFEDTNSAPTNGVHSPDTPAPAQVQTNANAGTTYRLGAGPNEVLSESKVARMNTADMQSGHAGILNTARTSWGSPAGRLTPQTRVMLANGSDTTLAAAEKMGLVERLPDGSYREAAPAEVKPEPTSAPDMTPVPLADGTTITVHELHAHTDEAMNAAMKGLEQADQEEAVMRIGLDKADEKYVHDLARRYNIEPAEMQERVDAFHLAVMAELAPVAQLAGVADLEHFAEWADENYSEGELMDAFMAHIYGRDTSHYARMMERYVRTVIPRTEDVEAQGHKVTKGRDGNELVTINGKQTSLAAAVRSGQIK